MPQVLTPPQTLREAQEALARARHTLDYDQRRVAALRIELDEAMVDEARSQRLYDIARAAVVKMERPYGEAVKEGDVVDAQFTETRG